MGKRRVAAGANAEFMAAWSLSWSAAAPSSPHFRPAPAPSPGFSETALPFTGLASPTALAFSPDGRVFVAEKSGLIKVYDGLGDTTPTVFADLRTEVHNFWDRGLLGLALDPQFPAKPYVYVSYTYDAPIGGSAPTWGSAGSNDDGCPSPPGRPGPGAWSAAGCRGSPRTGTRWAPRKS